MSKNPLIMVVEDEIDLANSISNTIKETGKYDVVTCYSAIEALKHFKQNKGVLKIHDNPVRVIVLDIKIPDMDGLQFLEKIRLDFSPEKLGVIVLSAWEDPEKWQKAREGFVVSYLKKPFRSKDLLAVIGRFFAGKGKWMMEQTKWDTLAREAAREKTMEREEESEEA